jgi:hypothetical protein
MVRIVRFLKGHSDTPFEKFFLLSLLIQKKKIMNLSFISLSLLVLFALFANCETIPEHASLLSAVREFGGESANVRIGSSPGEKRNF